MPVMLSVLSLHIDTKKKKENLSNKPIEEVNFLNYMYLGSIMDKLRGTDTSIKATQARKVKPDLLLKDEKCLKQYYAVNPGKNF